MDEKEVKQLLRRYASSQKDYDEVLAHSEAVKGIAIEIAEEWPEADTDLVKTGALLHDIGRFRYPPGKESIKHCAEGGRILRKEGFEKHARIAERHIGAGISKKEIIEQDLPLPHQNFLPLTIEEKIVCIADKLISGTKRITVEEACERFKKEISPEVAKRLLRLYLEVIDGPRKTKRRTGKTGPKGHPY